MCSRHMCREFTAALSVIQFVPRLDSPGEEHYSYEYHQRAVESANSRIAELQNRLGTSAAVLVEAGETPVAVCAAAARERAVYL